MIGEAAYERAERDKHISRINHDFKVALGSGAARSEAAESFPCADGQARGAAKLTVDFLQQCLERASHALRDAGVSESAHVIVAEPVSVHSEELSDWLPHYRARLRELLEKRRMHGAENVYFGEIEFLPEPLAVFNYYRYGYRHAELTGKEKYCVLVLDVGGGTSDCSVVETTKEGEISQTGRNSKPFGSSSEPVGGYFINHHLAAHALLSNAPTQAEQRHLRATLKKCLQVMQGRARYRDLTENETAFFNNYQVAIYHVEKAKRQLTAAINLDPRGWTRDEPPAGEEWVDLPVDPYAVEPEWQQVPIATSTFQQVFLSEVWNPHLKPLIQRTVENARLALEGKPINRVILSGGTANIGWIGAWIRRDNPELQGAILVDIKEDYQEVVAKGLAIECSRRFFSPDHTSDFEMVTYNPLSLALGAGGVDPTPVALKPIGTSSLPAIQSEPGVMIPAATDVRVLEGKRLEWKVVSPLSAPKHIRFYFHASPPEGLETDPERTESRLNFEQSELHAPSAAKFDRQLKVELEMHADGTVTPKFIFREGQHATAHDVAKGRPFYMDMTSSRTELKTATKAYLGLDFGSSNTALAFVSAAAISQYQHDAEDPSWLELSDLEQHLPAPMALPLACYIAESGDALKRAKRARQFVETTLSLLLIALCGDEEKRARKGTHAGRHGVMKKFKQEKVSAGPIWHCVKEYVSALSGHASFTRGLLTLKEGPVHEGVNRAVSDVAQCKHDKVDEQAVDWNRPLLQLGNLARQVFERAEFGFFQESKLRAGKVHASFRRLHGQGVGSAPRALVLDQTPEDGQAFLLDGDSLLAIPLFPWVLLSDAEDSQRRKFLFFDGVEARGSSGFSYRCPGEPHVVSVKPDGTETLDAYAGMAAELLDGKFPGALINVLEISG